MKHALLYPLMSLIVIFSHLHAQTLKRMSRASGAPNVSTATPFEVGADIFEQYGWAKPQISGRELPASGGEVKVNFKGKELTFSKGAGDQITVKAADGKVLTATATTDDKRYFDHRSVVWVPRTVSRYYPSYTMQWYSQPYQASRMVATSRYNPSTKSTQTTYQTQFYTAYRGAYRHVTTWNWTTVTELQPKIIPSKHYSFHLGDNQDLTVFEKEGKHYLQNPSYMSAKGAGGVNCVLLDFNANGSYFDPQDRVMWTAWNPYDKGSKYKEVKGFRGNAWYSLLDLEESSLVTLSEENGKLKTESINSKYAQSKGKGQVGFQGLPEGATLKVNGQPVRLNAKAKPLNAEYGEFHYIISVPGHEDASGKFVVDETHPSQQIQYQLTGPAAAAKFVNPTQPEYFITVTNPQGEMRTYQSPSQLNLSLGVNQIDIEVSGALLSREVTVTADKPFELDITAEFKKDATSVTEEEATTPTDSLQTPPAQVPTKAAPEKKGRGGK